MPALLRINGVDLEALGLSLSTIGPAWSPPAAQREYTPIPGRYGAVAARTAMGEPKRIPVRLAGRLPSVADRATVLARLNRLLIGALRLEWSDRPGRVEIGHVDQTTISGLLASLEFVYGDLSAEFEFVIPTAVGSDASPIGLALPAGVDVRLDLGDASSAPTITVPGPWTDLRIAYTAPTGEELAALQLLGSIGADELVEIDVEHERIVLEDLTTGTRQVRLDLYGGGSFPWLDPRDAAGSAGPAIRSSAAGWVTYRRAWK